MIIDYTTAEWCS